MTLESLISRIRDPDPSKTSTSTALNKASISAHRMSTGVGLAKIRCRVRRCLFLIKEWYYRTVPTSSSRRAPFYLLKFILRKCLTISETALRLIGRPGLGAYLASRYTTRVGRLAANQRAPS